jgi:hypothetical protein
LPGRFSRRVWVDAAQLAEPAHVVSEVLHPNLGLCSNKTDGAHQGAAHVVGLRAKDMLDPDPHRGFRPVSAFGLVGQRLALCPALHCEVMSREGRLTVDVALNVVELADPVQRLAGDLGLGRGPKIVEVAPQMRPTDGFAQTRHSILFRHVKLRICTCLKSSRENQVGGSNRAVISLPQLGILAR